MIELMVKTKTEKPPVPYLDVSDSKRVRLYDIDDNSSLASKKLDRASTDKQRKIIDALNRHIVEPEFRSILPTTPERRHIEQDAKSFVRNEVGVEPMGDVFWRYKYDLDCSGMHHDVTGTNHIANIRNTYNEHLSYMIEMSTLIHEFTHSTGNNHEIGVFESKRGKLGVTSNLGMVTVRILRRNGSLQFKRSGDFFEEAFAEEVAARWREGFAADFWKYTIGNFVSDDIDLPRRFTDYDYTRRSGRAGTYVYKEAALATMTLDILSEKSGVDLYKIMKKMRQNPRKKVKHKRKFIQSIESVEPGLYRRLRDTPYSEKDFADAYKYVLSATQD